MDSYKVIYGIYRTPIELERALAALNEAHFRSNDVSLVAPSSKSFFALDQENIGVEGIITGATVGALFGGAFGWLIAIGAVAVPGIGGYVIFGPMIGTILGIGLGGGIGILSGTFIGMGIPKRDTKIYEKYRKNGGLILSVHADDESWARIAQTILMSTGAINVAA